MRLCRPPSSGWRQLCRLQAAAPANFPRPLPAPSRARAEGCSEIWGEALPPRPVYRFPSRQGEERRDPAARLPLAPAALPAGGSRPWAARWPLPSRPCPDTLAGRPPAPPDRQPQVTGLALAAGVGGARSGRGGAASAPT